jgi:lipid II isoglutaminyl synthase (glutamine-hydrolysing)
MRLLLAIWLGKLIFFLTRTFKIGGGSAAPGLYALKISPDLVTKLASQIPQNIVITGTNGKTTTSRMLDHFVRGEKLKTLRNSTGSNLERGIASALIERSNLLGQVKNIDLGIWELDEAAFNSVVFHLRPQLMVFLNAFRDQLDRYGEVDTVVRKWMESLEKVDWNPKIILNGNDANTAKLNGLEKLDRSIFQLKGVKYFGEKKESTKELTADFQAKLTKNSGLKGTQTDLSYPAGNLRIDLPIPGVYHVFDFLAAFSTYYFLNLPLDKIPEKLKNFSPAFGRVEQIQLGDKTGYIFLIKNPAGASLVFETIKDEIKDGDRLLMALNDNFADGTDVSWIWDAEFEKFKVQSERLKVICTGSRAYDLAVRLKYAGVETKQLTVESDIEEAFNLAKKDLEGKLFILPTYTALLELQKILTKHKIKKHYWKE